nr:hypothetical protein [Corynebacterium lactis]
MARQRADEVPGPGLAPRRWQCGVADTRRSRWSRWASKCRATGLGTGSRLSDARCPRFDHHRRGAAAPGDKLLWQWGLWTHTLQVREAFARDGSTPDALCIGGSGTVHALGDTSADDNIDIAAINEELTGRDSIQTTLAATRADVVDVIERSGVFEFIPLLQALDLHRSEPGAVEFSGPEGSDVVKRLRALPLERARDDAAGHDAALVNLLCLAALTSDELRHDVAAHVMEQLGWVGDDGMPLSGEDVEALCPASWGEMCDLGLCGEHALAPVARLDLLREALRK